MNKTAKLNTKKITCKRIIMIPPKLETLVIFSIPCEAVNVTKIIHKTAKTPITCVALKPNIPQVWVVSCPAKVVDNGIQTFEEVETSQTSHEASHMKVPIKAHLGPTAPRSEEHTSELQSR